MTFLAKIFSTSSSPISHIKVVLETYVLENFYFSYIKMKDEAPDSSKSVVTIY